MMTKNGKRAAWLMSTLRMLVVMTAWLGAGTAWADDAPMTQSTTTAVCLRKPSEPLKYPERAKDLRLSGKLRARLTFTRPDSAPSVEILAWGGSPEMADAAEIYLRGYRLPCLGDGQSVALDQEVVFTALADEEAQASSARSVWDCLRTPGSFSYEGQMQTGRLARQRANGTLLLELSFDAPDAPPKFREIYNSAPNAFVTAAENHTSEYRLPCQKPGAKPARVMQAFHFRASSDDMNLALKDMSLVPFLRVVKDVDKVHVKFDLGTMACPFKLKWTMYEPADRNDVVEVGPRVALRQPFMDWLSTLSLNLGRDQMEALLGAEMVLTVPCGTVEL